MTENGSQLAAATDLAKRYADGAGLQPFSFTLASGELVVVRGRSGSGKSTLLALLAGWIAPDGGQLVRLGPWGEGGIDRTWKGTAILPQVIAPILELTMTENVAMALRLTGMPRRPANARAQEILAALDLTDEAGLPEQMPIERRAERFQAAVELRQHAKAEETVRRDRLIAAQTTGDRPRIASGEPK